MFSEIMINNSDRIINPFNCAENNERSYQCQLNIDCCSSIS